MLLSTDSKKECEEYDFTTSVESAGEDSSEEIRKRKHTKKDWGDDFVTGTSQSVHICSLK